MYELKIKTDAIMKEEARAPPWVMRPDGQTPSADRYQAPEPRKAPVQEQVPPKTADVDPKALIKADQGPSGLMEDDLAYLRSQGIVQMQDGSGRWMKVDQRPDDSIIMTPARALFLNSITYALISFIKQ